jgi:hypothetical protein
MGELYTLLADDTRRSRSDRLRRHADQCEARGNPSEAKRLRQLAAIYDQCSNGWR